jgi:para-aminobenzoate synthetase/4-amino-4-deoxychorismate lyase
MKHKPRLWIGAPEETDRSGWLEFENPVEVTAAYRLGEVTTLLEQVDAATQSGLWAAGFVTYEAAAAFDPALVTHRRRSLPLAWFGFFRSPRFHSHLPPASAPPVHLDWVPSLELAGYQRIIGEIHRRIESGDCYQVNFTFRLRTAFAGDPWAIFLELAAAQPTPHSAFIDIGDHALCSASPELFFRLDGSHIVSRPMKGTAPRGLRLEDDRQRALDLFNSEKERAENLMIVDMVRNDLGRIAETGSVRVERLFDIERYESIYQMTSTVEAETARPLAEIFAALFPCASITGAPKVRTTEIITQLEDEPRGIYTGAIGYAKPGRQAKFNVAIRTLHIDRIASAAEYGTGSGIVWDSVAESEYYECATKALVLSPRREDFSLIETLRWTPDDGYDLLERHLHRLQDSAEYFGFPLDLTDLRAALDRYQDLLARVPQRIRLTVSRRGEIHLEHEELELVGKPWVLVLAAEPVDPANRFLYHKTSDREVYEKARDAFPGYDDVLLWNSAGELTESTVANLAVELDGICFTPPVECGLLPGIQRAELLFRDRIRERILRRRDLALAEDIRLFNSVRGWIPVARIDTPSTETSWVDAIWRNSREAEPYS